MMIDMKRLPYRRFGQTLCLLLAFVLFFGFSVDAAVAQTKQQSEAELRQEAKQAVLNKLAQLKLPANPTRVDSERLIESARGYANQLSEIGLGFSANDNYFKTLDQVPAEHVDLLLAEVANDTRLRMYIARPVRAMDLKPEVIKQRIIQNLDETPANIGVLIRNGWCEDARAITTEKIIEANDPVSLSWFAAAIDLQEPKLYEKLHELTIHSEDADKVLLMLEALSDYDLLYTLQVVTKRIDSGTLNIKPKVSLHANQIRELRFKAAQNGDIDSFAWLIDSLKEEDPFPSLTLFVDYRLPVIKLIDFKGSNLEIKAWFKETRSKLVFDQFRERYVIGDD
jgi:hypothetical protein